MPQLAWHLAWHIVARPRPLPAHSNVAVDKPIKKPLLNALCLLLFHAFIAQAWGNASNMEQRERRRTKRHPHRKERENKMEDK